MVSQSDDPENIKRLMWWTGRPISTIYSVRPKWLVVREIVKCIGIKIRNEYFKCALNLPGNWHTSSLIIIKAKSGKCLLKNSSSNMVIICSARHNSPIGELFSSRGGLSVSSNNFRDWATRSQMRRIMNALVSWIRMRWIGRSEHTTRQWWV